MEKHKPKDENLSISDVSNLFDASYIFKRGSNIKNDNLYRVNGYRRALVELMDKGVIALHFYNGEDPNDYR